MNAIADVCVVPLGVGVSVSTYITECERIFADANLNPKLHAYGTNIEGEWDEVMDVVRGCFHELKRDCSRIGSHIKIDYREGNESRMKSKIESLEQKLGRKLKT